MVQINRISQSLRRVAAIERTDVSITLDNGADPPVTYSLHAMWGGSGLHYGANAVVAPGIYDVTVDIAVPAFARSASDELLYRSPISATFSGYVHP